MAPIIPTSPEGEGAALTFVLCEGLFIARKG